MPDMSNTGLTQCEDCGHHFQISPRGEIQLGACPDCGGKRLFRMQPNPVQSEGTLRNMVDMETGKDAGGNPDGEGILAPPSGHAILTAFMDNEVTTCPHCGWNTRLLPGESACPKCHWPFEPDPSNGIPDELRGQIAGAPLTEGTIMQTEHTDPYDTGAHGRDEYTHSKIAHIADEIIRAVTAHPGITIPEISRVTGTKPNLLYRLMPAMTSEGLIGRPTSNPRGWYAMSDMPPGADIIPGAAHSILAPTMAPVQSPEHPDPWMDNEPGSTTFPEHWTGHLITTFVGDDRECPNCHLFTSEMHCPNCGAFIDDIASNPSGIPAELRPQIGGAPLTEGSIFKDGDDTVPYDTGNRGRDEYTHGSVLSVVVESAATYCPNCGQDAVNIHGECQNCHALWAVTAPKENELGITKHPDPWMDSEPGTLTIPEHWGKTADYVGYPNWDTWNTKLILDNDEHLHKMQNQMAREGWSPDQIRNWTIENVIGPYNKEAIEDAHKWNVIPEHERVDPHFEQFINKNPSAQEAIEGLGFGPDISDIDPQLIDHEMVDWSGIHHDINNDYQENLAYERGEDPIERNRKLKMEQQKNLDIPGKDTFPSEWVSKIADAWTGHDPLENLRCPNCRNRGLMIDKGLKEMFCPYCDWGRPINTDIPGSQQIQFEDIENYMNTPPIPIGHIPKRQGKISNSIEDIIGLGTPTPRNNLNWTPGMKGRGIVLGDEPHTWNTFDPNADIYNAVLGPLHSQYVESLGVNPEYVDWNTGIEIDPDGKVISVGGHDVAPFIKADPRLKHVEDKFFSFSSVMPTLSRTNNMEPYDSLWTHEADVEFNKGPLAPTHSITVQPSEAGIHGAHTGRRGVLSFLDAYINGIPVRGNGSDLIARYGFRKSPDFGKPVVVAVHDPAHLPVAVEALQHPNGRISPDTVSNLMSRIQQGEIAAPPGIDAQTLEPLPGTFPEHKSHTASFWSTLGEAALPVAGLALAPETGGASLALDAGEAGALLGDAAATGGEAASAADAAGTAGGLMSKAMSGAGGIAKAEGVSSLVNQGLGAGESMLGMGQGQQGGGGGAGYSGPLQQFTHVLAAFVESDYETPASNPDVGVKHDDPEDVDQKEFNDQDKSPENPKNPNLQDSGSSGEDEVRKDMDKDTQAHFSPDSPGIQRMEMLMPLIEKYYHSDESGANDPMLQGLHEMLESESPGYLERANAEAAERFMHNKKQPDHVHASVKESIIPPMQQGNLQAQQQALDPTGANPSQQPSSMTPPGGGAQQGHCKNCGAVLQASGYCPQCGQQNAQEGEGMGILPGGPSVSPNPQTFAHTDLLASFVDSVNHQGPVTPEQIAAVQQYLIQEGRVDEVPNVPLDPGNPEYAKILSEIQNRPNVPPSVTPEEQTQPPAPQQAPPGGMPVPGMAPGETGGQPMQPMSSFLPEINFEKEADILFPPCPQCGQVAGFEPYPFAHGFLWCNNHGCQKIIDPKELAHHLNTMKLHHDMDISTIPEAEHPLGPHTGADNVAPRCPKCGSGTTGLVGDQDHNARCHACHNVWKLKDVVSDENYGQTSIAKTAEHEDHQQHDNQANPVGVPAAEQEDPVNQGGDEDSSLTWKDSTGAPLKAGQQYQMVNPSYQLPDLVRIERVKPDGIDVTLLGTYANDPSQHDPNTLTTSVPISKQDMEMQHLSFEPVNETADDRNNEPPTGSQAPGFGQVPPSGQTTDERANSEPEMLAQSHVENDPDCPRCGHREFTSSMINPESTEHNCFRCGHDWITEEKPMEYQAGVDLSWLNEDDDAEDLSPRQMGMSRAQVQSRNISDIAEKDHRLRAVREHLNQEKDERTHREAGRHFTPKEQRELIDEDGVARNSDMLDLEGTHYKSAKEQERVNADNAPDSHLFLGI